MSRKLTETQKSLRDICDRIKKMLIAKNQQYGNSVIEPVRIFSKARIDEQLKVRIDDKLSRIYRGNDLLESDTDVIEDLIGYLILLLHARTLDGGIDEVAREYDESGRYD